MVEIASLIANFILGSGIIGMLVFYTSKKRKASAEANQSEAEVESKFIQNAQQSAAEWKEISLIYKADNKLQSDLIDKLYIEKSEDRAVIHNLIGDGHKKDLKAMELTYKACTKRACANREPQTGF